MITSVGGWPKGATIAASMRSSKFQMQNALSEATDNYLSKINHM